MSSEAIFDISFNDTESIEEIHISEKLIKEYQDLNEKIDKLLNKIQKKRNLKK